MAGRRHLVVVIPGIGGSVLEDRSGARVWDVGPVGLVQAARHAERLSVDGPGLCAVGLIRSRRLVPGWTVVHGYDALIRRLGGLAGARVALGRPDDPVLDANVVMFPYDFRLGVVAAAELLDAQVRARLAHLGGDPGQRVVVVAHSLGGLVARYWLGPLRGWRCCRALITLGTPFRGAPKALQLMVNGVLGGRLDGLTRVLRGWPSVAELLPRYPAVWDVRAQVGRYPFELPVAGLAGPARAAYRVHEDMDAGWRAVPREATEVDARLGWSHPTLNAAFWRDGVLTVAKTAPSWLSVDGWAADRGDGTVPAFSAVPLESSTHSPLSRRVRQRHGPLGAADFVADLVDAYETYSPGLSRVRGDEHSVAIGLDLDSEYVAGQPVPVAVTIEGDDVADGPVTVSASVRVAGTARVVQDIRLQRRGSEFVGEVTGLVPGMYDVVVSAPDTPGAGDLSVLESIEVIDG